MKVEENKVVVFHYTVNEGGEKVESSHDRGEPLAFLVGKGALIPGLEKALTGREAGATFWPLLWSAGSPYGSWDEGATFWPLY